MKTKHLFKGIVLLVLAAAIILDASGLVTVGFLRLVVSVLMLYIFVKSVPSLNFYGLLIPASVVTILFDKELGIEKFTPFPVFFCALFAAVGLSLIFGAAPLSKKKRWLRKNHGRTPDNDGESNILISGIMLSTAKYLSSENLESVTVSVKLSNVELYFDKAKLNGNEAKVYVDIYCSNLCIYVPSDVLVVDMMDDKTMSNIEFCDCAHTGDDAKKLILAGSAKMSNLEVVYI